MALHELRPLAKDFISAGDPAFLLQPISKRQNLPAQAEQPDKAGLIETAQKLIEDGGLANHVAAGSFPAKQLEPATELARRALSVTAGFLLDQAAKEPKGSQMRLLLVTAYNIACWVECYERRSFKSVRQVCSETFEVADPKKGYKMLAEDVYHDKTRSIICWKIWGREWCLEAQSDPKVKFTILAGPALEMAGNLVGEVYFKDDDVYTYSMVRKICRPTKPPGLIGSLASTVHSFAYKGSAIVTNAESGLSSEVDLSEPGILSTKPKHSVKGFIYKNGKLQDGVKISGTWDERLVAKFSSKEGGKDEKLLWEKSTAKGPDNLYNFSDFAVQCNHLSLELLAVLPPTDSRLRKDVRAIEEGLWAAADSEQARLVELSNARCVAGGGPTWFEPQPAGSGSKLVFRYKGGYWETRAAKARGDSEAWAGCPDIFGLGPGYLDPSVLVAPSTTSAH